jgi:hypothetical protein
MVGFIKADSRRAVLLVTVIEQGDSLLNDRPENEMDNGLNIRCAVRSSILRVCKLLK